MSLNTNLYLFLENFLFFALATSLIVVLGWAWRDAKPFSLPEALPGWFKIWLGSVQVLGLLLPLLVMLLWGVWWGYTSVLTVLGWYFVMLGLQILSEIVTLRQYHTVVWVMVPYLYLPYRFWQLYEGWTLLGSETNLLWVRNLLILELVVWIVNYALDVSQLPRLLRWELKSNSDISST
ncbi:hypothetical protein [Cylindrospermum sp. FACHB-282]|uniref:hypothetical protein n=1 Tax=Cylindrospermum sp. FACHB-282 TaxID=2692794 RepID=UPI001686C76D|nr:hypothetical protein [Cylindrospermum sp. FACHB-282]MBD2387556.1 hypothetical protein [Cylindrospermum sp. FACHB-282]